MKFSLKTFQALNASLSDLMRFATQPSLRVKAMSASGDVQNQLDSFWTQEVQKLETARDHEIQELRFELHKKEEELRRATSEQIAVVQARELDINNLPEFSHEELANDEWASKNVHSLFGLSPLLK